MNAFLNNLSALYGLTRVLGIALLLLVIMVITTLFNEAFVDPYNLTNLMRWTGMLGILALGVAFVIITGGIDLSIGSVVALTGIVLMFLIDQWSMNPWAAVGITVLVGTAIGLLHGVLIGYCNLQPFIVTLCGLMGYRGLAKLISDDTPLSLTGEGHQALTFLANGTPVIRGWEVAAPLPLIGWVPVPTPMLILIVVAVLGAVFLHKTVAGRYLLAMGRNSEAARFSGINTRRMTLLAYVLCSTLTAMGGVLFALYNNTVQPSSHGNFYELYAIAAAVLGGCSLRGGTGSVAGVIIGTAVMRSLINAINLLGLADYWEYIIIGGVLLIGVMADELGRTVINHLKTRRRREMLAATGLRENSP